MKTIHEIDTDQVGGGLSQIHYPGPIIDFPGFPGTPGFPGGGTPPYFPVPQDPYGVALN